jgi:hypothetical protein
MEWMKRWIMINLAELPKADEEGGRRREREEEGD